MAETASTSGRDPWSSWYEANFCFPGSEIPEWVNYQNEGSSLTIDLPPHWYNNFFGFVLCFVPSCDSSDGVPSYVRCTCNFIDSDCEICCLLTSQPYKTTERPEHPKSDHVFVKYSESGEVVSKYSLCQKVRFQFSPSNDCCKVIKCGVHLVYKDESTESGDHDIAKEDQEEDLQKRIKQRNIVHEEQRKSSTSASKHRERPENDEEEVGHSEKRRRKGGKRKKKDKSSRSLYETQEEEADMMDDQNELEDEDANMNYRETTHQMDDQDDAAGENAQDLLAAAGLEDSDAEDEMAAPSSAAVRRRQALSESDDDEQPNPIRDNTDSDDNDKPDEDAGLDDD